MQKTAQSADCSVRLNDAYVVLPFYPPSSMTRSHFPVGVVATIGVRAFINCDPVKRDKGRLADTLDVFQMITLISSLITNTLGTGIISLKAWYAWYFCLDHNTTQLGIGGTGDGLSRILNVSWTRGQKQKGCWASS
jgi:hypothetical protein